MTDKDAAADLTTYETAVDLLKKKPGNDPLNWTRLARIHWDSCPHNNWFFLPWHRAYIHYFERICRKVTNKPGFMLPYWDWSVDRKIPPQFWNKNSSLFNNTREANANSMTRIDIVDRTTILDPMLKQVDFLIFGSPAATRLRQRVGNGTLESVHNYIHGFVGGDMGDFMSPLDPIFWLHHAFIDRLWAEWQLKNPGKDPTQDVWLNTPMVFVDESGKSVKTAGSEMLSISDLGYVYSGVPRVAEALPPGKRAFAMAPPLSFQATAMANADPKWEVGLERAGSKFTASVVDVPQKLRKALDRVALEEEPPPVSTRLIIEDMMVDPKVTFGVRVYLNCPNLEMDPGPKDPHFVGNVFFFGLDHRPLGHTEKSGRDAREVATSAILDLTHTLRGLGKAGMYEKDKSFDVQCLAVPLHEGVRPQGRVRFREFRLEVASNV